jgi:hypothetical protein
MNVGAGGLCAICGKDRFWCKYRTGRERGKSTVSRPEVGSEKAVRKGGRDLDETKAFRFGAFRYSMLGKFARQGLAQ